jgi:hypothetical protein
MKMDDKQKKRTELRIMKKFIDLENKQTKHGRNTNLNRAHDISDKMSKVLDDTKVSKMASIKNEKLYGLFIKWVDGKNREFAHL